MLSTSTIPMEAELKTDFDAKGLPQFEFITDLPMQSLVITDLLPSDESEDLEKKNLSSRIVEVRKEDDRANDGRKRVRLIASSDATDLVGDVMTKNALTRMKNAAVGTTIFLNHDPTIPESVFGSVEKSELTTKTVTVTDGDSGKTQNIKILCLEYDVIVEETNDRAVNTWKMIDSGVTKLGASVTIAIIEKTTMSDGRRAIDDVIYLETSIVGIPCNQTAWVQYVKSSSWVKKALKSMRELQKKEGKPTTSPMTSIKESQTANIDELVSNNEASPPNPGTSPSGKSAVPNKEPSSMSTTIVNAKSAQEAVIAFKDLFSEYVKDYIQNPWLYTHLLENSLVDLIYFNSEMTTDDKMVAAGEMFEAFKSKMLEVLKLYWTEREEEGDSKAFILQFNEAASKHIQEMFSKAGARNSSKDQSLLDSAHDAIVSLGAKCGSEEKSEKTGDDNPDGEATDEKSAAELALEVQLTEATATVESLTTEKAALTTEIEGLKKANKDLTLSVAKWKAGALTATELLESELDTPALRPGESVN